MSRSRMIGIVSAAVAAAGLFAGCGGGGFTAAESTPTAPGAAAPAASGAPAAPDPSTAVGAFAPSDPSAAAAHVKGYERFPKERAGKIFVDQTPKPEVVPAPASGLPGATPTPSGALATPTTTPTTPTSPQPVAATPSLSASLTVDGAVQVAKVGDGVPAANPQFTVQAIAQDKVTLKLNSGTLPGGGNTVDIAVGSSVTLTDPSTGTSYVVKAVEVKAQA